MAIHGLGEIGTYAHLHYSLGTADHLLGQERLVGKTKNVDELDARLFPLLDTVIQWEGLNASYSVPEGVDRTVAMELLLVTLARAVDIEKPYAIANDPHEGTYGYQSVKAIAQAVGKDTRKLHFGQDILPVLREKFGADLVDEALGNVQAAITAKPNFASYLPSFEVQIERPRAEPVPTRSTSLVLLPEPVEKDLLGKFSSAVTHLAANAICVGFTAFGNLEARDTAVKFLGETPNFGHSRESFEALKEDATQTFRDLVNRIGGGGRGGGI
ncbi:MAG: hypothetical protein J0L97_03565 [Alphaproteobacteria bacterium]|nr:hypothetical protein [Alphaproteobacteria bacterium]